MHSFYQYTDEFLHLHHHIDFHPKDEDFVMHVHDHYEIAYFIQGSGVFLVEGNTYPLTPGSVLLMRPTESHRIKILENKPYERYVVHFYPEILEQTDPSHLLLEPFLNHPLGCRNLYVPGDFPKGNILDFIKAMCKPDESLQVQRLSVVSNLLPLLNEIREIFTRKITEKDDGTARPKTHQIIDYVNHHLTDVLSVETLASRFFLSPSQFSRIFKQATGSSVWSYITIKRLMVARNQIQNGVQPTDAATTSGFRDYSCFYRAYVKRFGRTPKQDINKNN